MSLTVIIRHRSPRSGLYAAGIYSGCQKYVPIELVNLSKVIASEAKQSDAKHRPEQSRRIPRYTRDDPLTQIRLLRRKVPRNDSLSEHIFDSYDRSVF